MNAPWQPPLPLMRAMRTALTTMQPFYGRTLAMATQTSEAAERWVATYCRSTLGKRISLDAILEAADRWPAQFGKETPYPAEFAAFAASVYAEWHPETPAPVAAAPERVFPRPAHADAVDALSRQAYAVLRDWALVSEVWAVLWELATTDAMRDDVRLGRVPKALWDQTIGEVANGRVAQTPGPIGRRRPGVAA